MKKKHPELLPADLASQKKSVNSHSVSKSEMSTDSIMKGEETDKNILTQSSDSLNNVSEHTSMTENHKNTSYDNSSVKDSTEMLTPLGNDTGANDVLDESQTLEKSNNNIEYPSETVSLTDTKHITSEAEIKHASSVLTSQNHHSSQSATTSTNDFQKHKEQEKRIKKTDMYEFQSEEESSDDMKPGNV